MPEVKNTPDWAHGFTFDFHDPKNETVQISFNQVRQIFAQPDACNGDTLVYEVCKASAPADPGDLTFGATILHPGKAGDEYFMTKGHYHKKRDTAEVYYTIRGRGLMLLENGEEWSVQDMLPGQVTYIPKHHSHRLINTGDEPLEILFTLRGDAGNEYGEIETKGFRHIVVDRGGKPECIGNPNYK